MMGSIQLIKASSCSSTPTANPSNAVVRAAAAPVETIHTRFLSILFPQLLILSLLLRYLGSRGRILQPEDGGDLRGGNRDSESSDSLVAESAVMNAPVLNHTMEGVIGYQIEAEESQFGDWASEIAALKPGLDVVTVVGDARGQCDRIGQRKWVRTTTAFSSLS